MRDPLLLTVEQAGHELGISRTQVFGLLKSGELESVKIGRSRRARAGAVDSYVARLRSEQAVGAA